LQFDEKPKLETDTFGALNDMRPSKLLTTFLLLFIAGNIFAQTASVRGFVYDKASGEPMLFTNVYLKGTTYGTTTDGNGFYNISKIPAGKYTLTSTFLGFDTANVSIDLKPGSLINEKLYLSESTIKLKTFDVSAERQEARTQVKMSVQKLTPKQIAKLPSVGGQADLAQYLQVIPGVIFTGDQGGQLYIRGGSPIQNKVILDGMIIYNPFHSIGLFSVFDTDIMSNADVYTGGFSAEYGGRISSIMDVSTRDGNKKRTSGKISASPFLAKLNLEGPIKKAKDKNDGTITYVMSAKSSYLEQTSPILYSYVDTNGLPFNFTDLYGKISFGSANGSKFNIFGLRYTDRVNFSEQSSLNWGNTGIGGNFVLIPENNPVLVEGGFAFSNYLIDFQEFGAGQRTSGINGFNMNLNFTYFQGENELKWGIEGIGFETDFTFFNSLNRRIEQNENTTEIASFIKYRWTSSKLILDPSFRLHYYASLNTFSPEPRLGLKYNITDNFRFKAAGGLYSQNLIQANSDRDVVNLFFGFLSGPENLPEQFIDENGKTQEVNHKLQKAIHAIAGFEYDLTRRMNVNIEGYYKRFTQLSNVNRNKIFDDNTDNAVRPDILKKDFIIETGDAYGVDFVFKYDFKRLYLWAVYSHAYVTRWDGIREYFPVFDRRHNVNLLGTYTFGKDLNWELNARWNMGSGFPLTPTQGFYQKFNFTEGIYTDYTTSNTDEVGVYYGELNSQRLPFYHRMDISVKRKILLGQNSELDLNFGITNIYNRENIFYFDRVTFERVNQLPFLPNFGLNLSF